MLKGLLDFAATPEGQGVVSGLLGYAAGAQRGTPLNNLGRGGLAGLAGYAGAIDRQQQQADNAFNQQYRTAQMNALKRQMEKDAAQQAWRQQLPALMAPKLQGQTQQAQMLADQMGPDASPEDVQAMNSGALMPATGFEYGADKTALQRHLMDPASPFADKLLEQQLLPKERKLMTVKPGDVVLDESNPVKPIFTAPAQPKKTGVEEMLDAAGITDPALRQDFILQALKKQTTHAPAASANVVLRQEGEEAKSVGKFFGDTYATIQNSGYTAQSKVNRYNRLGQLLEGVTTGRFTGAGLEVAKAASALGFNIDPNMANKEAAQALSGEIALELRNPSGGAGMPGAMSDADRQFLVNMVPGLTTTPDGRRLMIETAQKLAKRDMDVARIARDYRKRNGSLNEGFYDELMKFSEANPLFPAQPAAQSNGGFSIRRVR